MAESLQPGSDATEGKRESRQGMREGGTDDEYLVLDRPTDRPMNGRSNARWRRDEANDYYAPSPYGTQIHVGYTRIFIHSP